MRAAVAILAGWEVQNFARKVVFALDRQYNRPFLGSVLPAHVSLKQPFTFEDMAALERWFDSLAAAIEPFEVVLDCFYHASWAGYSILGLSVVETPILRSLHEQVNRELARVVADPRAAFDGEAYQFHLTLEVGPVGEADVLKAYFDGVDRKEVNLTFTAQDLALFYYGDRPSGPGSFMVYKMLPVGGGGKSSQHLASP